MLRHYERRYVEDLRDRYSKYMFMSALAILPALTMYSTAFAFSNAPSFLARSPNQAVALLNAISIALIVLSIALTVTIIIGRSAASSYSFGSARSMLLASLVQSLILLPLSFAGTALMYVSAEDIGAQASQWLVLGMGMGGAAAYAATSMLLLMARNVMSELFKYYIPKRRVEKPGGPAKGTI